MLTLLWYLFLELLGIIGFGILYIIYLILIIDDRDIPERN